MTQSDSDATSQEPQWQNKRKHLWRYLLKKGGTPFSSMRLPRNTPVLDMWEVVGVASWVLGILSPL